MMPRSPGPVTGEATRKTDGFLVGAAFNALSDAPAR